MARPLRIYMITGETSGDAIGADIMSYFKQQNIEFEIGGLAGPKMMALGATSLFDISHLSVMGFTEVLGKLPKFLRFVRQVADDALSFKPDVVVLIDSPDFNYAVAKKIKKSNPDIPVVKYICPSVWAWRQGRAKKMNAFIDHVLAILPFEPDLMKELEGPPTSFVGHPMSEKLEEFAHKDRSIPSDPVNLLVLPGSRNGEVKRLMPVIRDTLQILDSRGFKFNAVLPAVDNLADTIRQQVQDWPVKPDIVQGKDQKELAFQNADTALACSGTVMLELGLFGIPTISIYKLDGLGFVVKKMVKAWTACLPNLITDRTIISERFEEYAHPQLLARELESLCVAGHVREAQIEGFKDLHARMSSGKKNQNLAARKILQIAKWAE